MSVIDEAERRAIARTLNALTILKREQKIVPRTQRLEVGPMQGANKARGKALCEQATIEQAPKKLQ
jgi:hypothetical protein